MMLFREYRLNLKDSSSVYRLKPQNKSSHSSNYCRQVLRKRTAKLADLVSKRPRDRR